MKLENWKAAYAEHSACNDMEFFTIEQIENAGIDIISANVPGELQLDMMKQGIVDDLFYSDNTFKAQRLENLHAWYYTKFDADADMHLKFCGIDTVADIYLNGKMVKSVSNMFLEYEIFDELNKRDNELIVHIKPVCIEARKYELPASCATQAAYNYSSLYMRKAAHAYGWDIMPRIVTSGIWKPVELVKTKRNKIKNVFLSTSSIDGTNAMLNFCINTEMDGDFVQDYSVRLTGVCDDSRFEVQKILYHTGYRFEFLVENCKLWFPKYKGKPNLYDVKVELLYMGEPVDTYEFKSGIRTVKLERTDIAGENGEFCFYVNGVKTFVTGTNWVPLDAFHSRDEQRIEKALELLDESGCNMVRCWGGNVYENKKLFDFCDKNGIMIWQDFAMGCAIYPFDTVFAQKMLEEAEFIIKRYRNHPSLVLWAGDNECDEAIAEWFDVKLNPDSNWITRKVIKQVLTLHDRTRPYLPSSPYISDDAFYLGKMPSERHIWGPRDYFKGNFYKNSECHFASETGYHGCNSPQSLEKFLKQTWPFFDENGAVRKEMLAHATAMEEEEGAPYTYRIRLMCQQVKTLFSEEPENLNEFAKMSQISQAEADKFLIEHFRIQKWRKTGLIWWNLIDGWPQISDAVADYYFEKKLAFHYIKRAQNPVLLMFDEPNGNNLPLYASNDCLEDKDVSFRITDITEEQSVLEGNATVCANAAQQISSILCKDKHFYLIEFTVDGATYKNHYYTGLLNISFENYLRDLKKSGLDDFTF